MKNDMDIIEQMREAGEALHEQCKKNEEVLKEHCEWVLTQKWLKHCHYDAQDYLYKYKEKQKQKAAELARKIPYRIYSGII